MAVYLNTNKNLENYKELYNEEYFVDKSKIISLINKKINTKSKYLCITRPRRFGKSSIANMLGAYYSKAVDSKDIFDNLDVNIEDIINMKMDKNEMKYPVEKAKGKSTKYTEL